MRVWYGEVWCFNEVVVWEVWCFSEGVVHPSCSLHCNDNAVCVEEEEEENLQGEQHSAVVHGSHVTSNTQ